MTVHQKLSKSLENEVVRKLEMKNKVFHTNNGVINWPMEWSLSLTWYTVFPWIVSAETFFLIWPYVLWTLVTVHKSAETIQGKTVIERGTNYRSQLVFLDDLSLFRQFLLYKIDFGTTILTLCDIQSFIDGIFSVFSLSWFLTKNLAIRIHHLWSSTNDLILMFTSFLKQFFKVKNWYSPFIQ